MPAFHAHVEVTHLPGIADPAGATVDRTRTAWLEGRGFRVMRFWNNDVLQNLNGVIETILLALRIEGSPPPHPAPIEKSRGRGKG